MGQKMQDSTALYTATWNNSTPVNTALSAYGWGYSSAIVTIQNTGTVTPGVIGFQGFDGVNWYSLTAIELSTGNYDLTYTLGGGSMALAVEMTGFSQFRVILSTAITGSGTSLISINESAAALSSIIKSSSGGVYNSSAPNLSNGQSSPVQLDSAGNEKVTLATTIAGEDITNDVLKVEERFSFSNITTGTTTSVKSGAGFLHALVINKPVASATITMYDNTAASGTKIGTIALPATLTFDTDSLIYDVTFATGLTIVTSGATDLTVGYR